MDTLAMLEELLEQDQFELLIPKDGMSGELRLVYLMNMNISGQNIAHRRNRSCRIWHIFHR